jgi:hypothetical protein
MGAVVWVDEMRAVVWANEMGAVMWADDMGVVVWADDIGVVSITVITYPKWVGGTLVLLLGSDGRDGRCARGHDGRCARGRHLRGAVGGTVVSVPVSKSVLTLSTELS